MELTLQQKLELARDNLKDGLRLLSRTWITSNSLPADAKYFSPTFKSWIPSDYRNKTVSGSDLKRTVYASADKTLPPAAFEVDSNELLRIKQLESDLAAALTLAFTYKQERDVLQQELQRLTSDILR